MAAPIVEQQKSQRNKAKDKERDNRKKEYRDEAFDGKGKKGRKQKQVAEAKKPQQKQEEKKHPCEQDGQSVLFTENTDVDFRISGSRTNRGSNSPRTKGNVTLPLPLPPEAAG